MNKQEIIREVVKTILKHAKPERIYLYGSHANGEAGKTSDIDIAYIDGNFRDNYLIEQDIEKFSTLLKIDVQNLAFTGERFKNRVQSTGRVLYSFNKKLRAEDGLHNFSKALERFSEAIEMREEINTQGFSDIYLDLAVKRFEFTYEMSWKAVKRYLDFTGIECSNPRACYKEAYVQKLIEDEKIWLDMIEQRNLSSHIYDETEIVEILEKIADYRQAFEWLRNMLENKLAANA
jgi:nucleotidyltransferase substrate binding protein (TIGR01987 family)